MYNENGFHNVMNYFRIIIIKLILYLENVIGVEFEVLIYSWFEIYIDDFDEYLLQKANAIMKAFTIILIISIKVVKVE
ncbi:hypothetical protein RhiirA4_454678 [Rhizophagus irregularis]|uniref:Uncharacterized protein n=1 Tax=Rhizophagus irregularis TaxID=588596 RepID=A0A2I1G3G0_9GLOM|nr:hypothetical protein RhiirA4_454678 [Rhizophagus irregularis]